MASKMAGNRSRYDYIELTGQHYSILYKIFASAILNKPEANIALLAMVILRINACNSVHKHDYQASSVMFVSPLLN